MCAGDKSVRKELGDVKVFLRSDGGEQGKGTAIGAVGHDGYSSPEPRRKGPTASLATSCKLGYPDRSV